MSTTDRTPLEEIRPVADRIVAALYSYCHRIEVAGSIRREKPMVGDIEIVAVPIRVIDLFGEEQPDQSTQLDSFLEDHGVRFIKNGTKYKRFIYGRHTVDLFLATRETFGSVFTIRTGSAAFSKWLVSSRAAGGAAPEPVRFFEARVQAHGRLLRTPEEADVFAAVGLPWIAPPQRNGPIENPEWLAPVWNYEGEDNG